jgi:hypothetical protein
LVKEIWRKARRGGFLALWMALGAQLLWPEARAEWELSPSLKLEVEESSNLLFDEDARSGAALWGWAGIKARRQGAKVFLEFDYGLGVRQLWLEADTDDTSRSLAAQQAKLVTAVDISPVTSVGVTNLYEDFEIYDLPDEDFELYRLSASFKRDIGAWWTTRVAAGLEDLESTERETVRDYQERSGHLRVGMREPRRHAVGATIGYRERNFERADIKDYEEIRFAVDERAKMNPRVEATVEVGYSQRDYKEGGDSEDIDGSLRLKWELNKKTEWELRFRTMREDTLFIPEEVEFVGGGDVLLMSLPANYREVRVNALDASLRRKMSPKTEVILQGAYQDVDGEKGDAVSGSEGVRESSVLGALRITRDLSKRATASVRIAGGRRDSTGRGDYDFASLMLSIEIRFGGRQ